MKFRILLFLIVLMPSLFAQAPAPATIRGVLVRWGTEELVGQATIELRPTTGVAAAVAITASQDNGEFVFSNIPGGSYRVVAMADGFAPTEYGQLRQNGSGRPLSVAPGERASLRMGIVPGGIISGRITDQNGQPMVYSNVDILKPNYEASGQITPVIVLSVTANDLGEFRAFWLPPGQYIVQAGTSRLNYFTDQGTTNPMASDTTRPTTFTSSTDRPKARAAPSDLTNPLPILAPVLSTYYGGAPDARSAQVVDLRSGEEASGIDIRIAPIQFTRRVHLNGVVVGPSGQPNQDNFGVSISTWPEGQRTVFASISALTTRVPATAPNSLSGAMRYVLDNGKIEGSASSGFYQIRATQGMLSGRVVIEASNQDLSVTIPLHQPSSVSGQVRIEAAANSTYDLTKLQVGIRTPPTNFFSSAIAADGQFRIEGVIDGDYQVHVLPFIPAPEPPSGTRGGTAAIATIPAGMENAYVKSVRLNNVDVANSAIRVEGTEAVRGLEIIVGLAGASINGRVVNARQDAMDRATVVLLPQGQPPYHADRYKSLITDKSGQFQFRGLPPGDYRLFAWEDVDPGAWFNPSFLAAFERNAVPIQLIEGQRQGDLEIPVIPVAR